MKFTIKREVTEVKETVVNVGLMSYCGSIHLVVNGWHVFKLKHNGAGRLIDCIPKEVGLKTNIFGKIILEND